MDEDDMTWTAPWASEAPRASPSEGAAIQQASVGFQPGKQVIQHGATSVANTGGPSVKKKSGIRRSSILKVTSTAPMSATAVSAQQDKRGPLKDIGNGRGNDAVGDDVACLAAGGGVDAGSRSSGGGKLSTGKQRRSSLGRRVSFSATTKVKEFEPTNMHGGTMWNSTYESSDIAASAATSSSASSLNDDNTNKMTSVTSQQTNQAALSSMDMTMSCTSTGMDMTCRPGQLNETGSESKENKADNAVKPAADPFAALFASTALKPTENHTSNPDVNDLTTMDVTCKPDFAGVGSTTTCLTGRGETDEGDGVTEGPMYMTVDVYPHSRMDMTAKMDMTCKPDPKPLGDREIDKPSTDPTEGMNMTCQGNSTLSAKSGPSTQSMGMTCKPTGNKSESSQALDFAGQDVVLAPEVTERMDMTCKIPTTASNQQNAACEGTERMDMSCNFPAKANKIPNQSPEVTECMDITCKLPSSKSSTTSKMTPDVTERMDMTCNIQARHQRAPDEVPESTEQMNLSCTPHVAKSINAESVPPGLTNPMDMTCNAPANKFQNSEPESSEGMEMTCKLPASRSNLPQCTMPEHTERMDMTCNVLEKANKTQNLAQELTERMDLTCHKSLAPTMTGANNQDSFEEVEMPKPVYQPASQSMTPAEPTLGMELTCNLPVVQKAMEEGSLEPTARMDLTCRVPRKAVSPEPERLLTERMEMTCKLPAKVPLPQNEEPEVTFNLQAKNSQQYIQKENSEEATSEPPKELSGKGVFESEESSSTSKRPSEPPNQGRMDLTFKVPENAGVGPAITADEAPLQSEGKSDPRSSATFTVDTKFNDQDDVDAVTPIRPLQRKGFVEEADTMAFSYSMLSSTRIMNSTAFSPGQGLVSLSYDECSQQQQQQQADGYGGGVGGEETKAVTEPTPQVASPSLLRESLQQQQPHILRHHSAPAEPPVFNQPRSEAVLQLDMLLKGLKTEIDGSTKNPGAAATANLRPCTTEPITNQVKGIFQGVELANIEDNFKVQALEVGRRKRAHEKEQTVIEEKKKKLTAGATAATATEDGRTTLVVERVSAFEHLHRKHREACPAKDYFDRHQGAWSLTENHGSYASVAFMQGSLSLNMVVGHRLQSEEIRTPTKNLLVQHFNIQSLELKSKVSSSTGCDNVVRLAHHLLLMSITPAKLGELCPNTRGLEKTLRFLMLKVHEASMFVVNLDRIDNTHCYFKVTDDFKVSVKFYSIKCGFSFKIALSYKSGFGACREKGVEYERGPSHNNLVGKDVVKTLFNRTEVGFKHFSKFVDKIDAYIAQLEKEFKDK